MEATTRTTICPTTARFITRTADWSMDRLLARELASKPAPGSEQSEIDAEVTRAKIISLGPELIDAMDAIKKACEESDAELKATFEAPEVIQIPKPPVIDSSVQRKVDETMKQIMADSKARVDKFYADVYAIIQAEQQSATHKTVNDDSDSDSSDDEDDDPVAKPDVEYTRTESDVIAEMKMDAIHKYYKEQMKFMLRLGKLKEHFRCSTMKDSQDEDPLLKDVAKSYPDRKFYIMTDAGHSDTHGSRLIFGIKTDYEMEATGLTNEQITAISTVFDPIPSWAAVPGVTMFPYKTYKLLTNRTPHNM